MTPAQRTVRAQESRVRDNMLETHKVQVQDRMFHFTRVCIHAFTQYKPSNLGISKCEEKLESSVAIAH